MWVLVKETSSLFLVQSNSGDKFILSLHFSSLHMVFLEHVWLRVLVCEYSLHEGTVTAALCIVSPFSIDEGTQVWIWWKKGCQGRRKKRCLNVSGFHMFWANRCKDKKHNPVLARVSYFHMKRGLKRCFLSILLGPYKQVEYRWKLDAFFSISKKVKTNTITYRLRLALQKCNEGVFGYILLGGTSVHSSLSFKGN